MQPVELQKECSGKIIFESMNGEEILEEIALNVKNELIGAEVERILETYFRKSDHRDVFQPVDNSEQIF